MIYFDIFVLSQRLIVSIWIIIGLYIYFREKSYYETHENYIRIITLAIGLDGAFALVVTGLAFDIME